MCQIYQALLLLRSDPDLEGYVQPEALVAVAEKVSAQAACAHHECLAGHKTYTTACGCCCCALKQRQPWTAFGRAYPDCVQVQVCMAGSVESYVWGMLRQGHGGG